MREILIRNKISVSRLVRGDGSVLRRIIDVIRIARKGGTIARINGRSSINFRAESFSSCVGCSQALSIWRIMTLSSCVYCGNCLLLLGPSATLRSRMLSSRCSLVAALHIGKSQIIDARHLHTRSSHVVSIALIFGVGISLALGRPRESGASTMARSRNTRRGTVESSWKRCNKTSLETSIVVRMSQV